MTAPHVTVIAEAGVNHNGRLDLALALVDAAAAARADVVKFQTFSAEKVATHNAGMAEYQKRNIGDNEPQMDMLRRLEIGPREHELLMKRCQERGIAFLSSSFDMQSLRFLIEQLQCPTIMIPSGEITNGLLLFHTGRAARHAILSTGMADLSAGIPPDHDQVERRFRRPLHQCGDRRLCERASGAGARGQFARTTKISVGDDAG
jgi:sialic acid synthase SpsE